MAALDLYDLALHVSIDGILGIFFNVRNVVSFSAGPCSVRSHGPAAGRGPVVADHCTKR